MNIETSIPQEFANDSKVWIYQCNRPLKEQEVLEMDEQLLQFYSQWSSHGIPVKGWAKVLFNQMIVVMADEHFSGVSGCSTDSMVRIIKSFERQYQIELFDRLTISFLINNKVQPLPIQQIPYAIQKDMVKLDSLLFNNLVDTKEKLLTEWIVPLNKSWLWTRVSASIIQH